MGIGDRIAAAVERVRDGGQDAEQGRGGAEDPARVPAGMGGGEYGWDRGPESAEAYAERMRQDTAEDINELYDSAARALDADRRGLTDEEFEAEVEATTGVSTWEYGTDAAAWSAAYDANEAEIDAYHAEQDEAGL